MLYSRTVNRWLLSCVLLGALLVCGCVNQEKQVAENEKKLAAEGITALEVGDRAPEFSASSADGSSFTLSAALAEQAVVLFFYPADDTPNTTRHLVDLGRAQAEFAQHGIAAYGVSPAPSTEELAYRDRYSITLPLLRDPGRAIARAYGCTAEEGRFPQRTAVGIDREGNVAFYIRGHATSKQILSGFGVTAKAGDQ